ncbi:YceH family protein [Puniceicoccaceae bacterium K14]|nr:YceH family protein [Puniceicoccaceae bacterium K14]
MNEDADIQLSIIEARILGCLCEKEVTTPDNYPLSLNSLINACNQKSNRFPVMELEEAEVNPALEALRLKKLLTLTKTADSRVLKYKHSFESQWKVSPSQRAILTELLIRGPQTPGELRGRCERMQAIPSVEVVREHLDQLALEPYALVRQLPKQPGRKDHRYCHTLTELTEIEESNTAEPMKVSVAVQLPQEAEERLQKLEAIIAAQAGKIDAIEAELAAFKQQFE